MPGAQNGVDTESGKEEAAHCRDPRVCAVNGPWGKEGRDGCPQARNESPRLREVNQRGQMVAGPGLEPLSGLLAFGSLTPKHLRHQVERAGKVHSALGSVKLLRISGIVSRCRGQRKSRSRSPGT